MLFIRCQPLFVRLRGSTVCHHSDKPQASIKACVCLNVNKTQSRALYICYFSLSLSLSPPKGGGPVPELTLLNISRPARASSHRRDTELRTQSSTMAPASKTAYITIVKRNILTLLVRTRRNIQKIYNDLEESLQLERQIMFEEELIDESEQNRFNEQLERNLAVN